MIDGTVFKSIVGAGFAGSVLALALGTLATQSGTFSGTSSGTDAAASSMRLPEAKVGGGEAGAISKASTTTAFPCAWLFWRPVTAIHEGDANGDDLSYMEIPTFNRRQMD